MFIKNNLDNNNDNIMVVVLFQVIGVAQIINKREGEQKFTAEDIKVIFESFCIQSYLCKISK